MCFETSELLNWMCVEDPFLQIQSHNIIICFIISILQHSENGASETDGIKVNEPANLVPNMAIIILVFHYRSHRF